MISLPRRLWQSTTELSVQNTILRLRKLDGFAPEHVDRNPVYIFFIFAIHTANVAQLADNTKQRARLAAACPKTCSQCGALVGSLYPRHEKQTKKSGQNDRKQI